MTDHITIPPAALEAAARADHVDWLMRNGLGDVGRPWELLEPEEQDEYRASARAACLAMLQSWPNMLTNGPDEGLILQRPAIILPLTETNDDKA